MGGHWLLLQTVAWTGMLLKYSQDANFAEAVSKTFDGEHPCPLCKKIKQARKSEQKDPAPSLAKMDLKYPKPDGLAPVAPTFGFHSWPAFEEYALNAVHTPPVPPPRSAVA